MLDSQLFEAPDLTSLSHSIQSSTWDGLQASRVPVSKVHMQDSESNLCGHEVTNKRGKKIKKPCISLFISFFPV